MDLEKSIEYIANRNAFRTVGIHSENLRAGFIVSPRGNPQAVNVIRPNYTILYLLRGTGTYVTSNGKNYTLTAGTLIQRFPGTKHSVYRRQDGKWVEFYLVLPANLYSALVNLGSIKSNRDVYNVPLNYNLFDKLNAFIDMLAANLSASTAKCLASAHQLLVDNLLVENNISGGKKTDLWLTKAQQALSEKFEEKINILQLASNSGMGYENFRKLFKKNTGFSPQTYRIRKKIEHACNLLQEEKYEIKEIADNLGYPDIFSFSKQFKKITGLPPSKFRNF